MFDDMFSATMVSEASDAEDRCPECGLRDCWVCGRGATMEPLLPGSLAEPEEEAVAEEVVGQCSDGVTAVAELEVDCSERGLAATDSIAQWAIAEELGSKHPTEAFAPKSPKEASSPEAPAVLVEPSPREDAASHNPPEEVAAKQMEEPTQKLPEEVVVTVHFEYKAQRWSHEFNVRKDSTVLQLKESMVKKGSPQEDAFSFDVFLKSNKKRRSNFDVITKNSDFAFEYIGPEDGLRRLERDRYVHAEEEKARLAKKLREEEHARIMAEKLREARELQDRRLREAEEARKAEAEAEAAEIERRRKQLEEKDTTNEVNGQNGVDIDRKADESENAKLEDNKVWEVIGGKSYGLVVRVGKDLASEKEPERVSNGSLLEELEMDWQADRLHYKLLSGNGPASGWVTIRLRTNLENVGLENRYSVRNLVIRRGSNLPYETKVEMQSDNQKFQEEDASSPGADTLERGIDGALRSTCWQCKNCPGWTLRTPSQSSRARKLPRKRDRDGGIETLRGHLFASLCDTVPSFGYVSIVPKQGNKEPTFTPGKGSQWPCAYCGCAENMHEDVTHKFGKYKFSTLPIPFEALGWSQVEIALWFDTNGVFHPGRRRSNQQRPAGKNSSEPLVSVIVPTTASRRPFHPFIWQCFYAQKYTSREIIIVDTCEEGPSEFFLSKQSIDKRVQYHHFNVPEGLWDVGIKRNIACYLANGEIIAHFDDDDMYAGCYLKDMVGYMQCPDPAHLEVGVTRGEPPIDATFSKKVLGRFRAVCAKLSSWYTFGVRNTSWGHYDTKDKALGNMHDTQLYGWGFSMVYLRSAWVVCPFLHTRIGEDYDVVKSWRLLGLPVVFMPDTRGICAHTNHGDNTASGADRGGSGFGNKLMYGPLASQVFLYEKAAGMLRNAQGPLFKNQSSEERRERTPSPQGRAPTPPGFRDRKPGARGGRGMAAALLRDAMSGQQSPQEGEQNLMKRASGFADVSDDSD